MGHGDVTQQQPPHREGGLTWFTGHSGSCTEYHVGGGECCGSWLFGHEQGRGKGEGGRGKGRSVLDSTSTHSTVLLSIGCAPTLHNNHAPKGTHLPPNPTPPPSLGRQPVIGTCKRGCAWVCSRLASSAYRWPCCSLRRRSWLLSYNGFSTLGMHEVASESAQASLVLSKSTSRRMFTI